LFASFVPKRFEIGPDRRSHDDPISAGRYSRFNRKCRLPNATLAGEVNASEANDFESFSAGRAGTRRLANATGWSAPTMIPIRLLDDLLPHHILKEQNWNIAAGNAICG
jgi:hypothetical protein